MKRTVDTCTVVRESVLELDRAGTAPSQPGPLWQNLLEGRTRVVDRFSHRGSRYLVLSPVCPNIPPPMPLTRRERQAVEAVVSGLDCKQIARQLGLSTSTVASHRARALRKLGLMPHELFGPWRGRAFSMSVGSQRWAVLVLPRMTERLPAGLTPTEREVAALVLEGHSNAEIAATRGRSVRTIANQVAAIFRKLGVSGRSQLVMLLRDAPPDSSEAAARTTGVDETRDPRADRESGPSPLPKPEGGTKEQAS